MKEQNSMKSYDELQFRDNFMFGKVMEDPGLCRRVLECLLGHISEGKPIRLDVYSEDRSGAVYDAEMENLNHKSIIAHALPESTVIFICTFDPFKQGVCRYTFTECCEEVSGLELKDGTTKIFFNCCYQGKDISEELRRLYDYIENGRITGDLTKEIHEAVLKGRRNEIWRTQYMREWAVIWDARDEGREEGREEGASLKVIEKVCVKLKKGYQLERIAEELEEDPAKIKEIIEVAERFKPDYDTHLIYEAMQLEPAEN